MKTPTAVTLGGPQEVMDRRFGARRACVQLPKSPPDWQVIMRAVLPGRGADGVPRLVLMLVLEVT